MTAYPGFYEAGTNTAASTVTVTVDAGNSSATAAYDLWNDKGAAHGDATTMTGIRLVAEAWDGTAWVTSGLPCLDERWMRVRVSDIDKTGDSTMTEQTTGYVPVGAGSSLVLGDIPKNCSRELTVYVDVPAGASAGGSLPRLKLVYEEAAESTGAHQTVGSGAGVIPDWLLDGVRRITRGRAVTGSGTAAVTISAGSWAYDGVAYTALASTATLNQTAADGALAAGQSYKAVLSQKSDKTVTATKGNKAVSPTAPSVPANEIYLATVTVSYQVGGTSVINNSDISTASLYRGEYLVEAGTGLNVTVGAGQALTSASTHTFRGAASTVALSDNATNYIWLRIDGGFLKNTTGTAPEFGSVPLATVVTAAGAISSVTDTRTWARPYGVLTLGEAGSINTASGVTVLDWAEIPYDCDCDEIVFSLATQASGGVPAGQTQVELMTFAEGAAVTGAGTTIYTNKGTSDQRPVIAYDATSLIARTYNHEVRRFTARQRVALYVTECTTGEATPPTDVVVTMHLRRIN